MTRADWILLTLVVAALPLVYAGLWGEGGAGERVRITAGEQQPIVYSLTRDRVIEVDGELGKSTIEIHDGQARFRASPCSGKVCVHSGWHSHTGEVTACLPNRISLQVVGAQRRYDSINF